MPSIRTREDNGCLFLDFRFHGRRFREQTLLADTPANRKKLEKVLAHIEAEIKAGTFEYAKYFPNSKAAQRLPKALTDVPKLPASPVAAAVVTASIPATPDFEKFANQWVDERSIEWRRSHTKSLLSTLNGRVIPRFRGKPVGEITKTDVLAFRADLAKAPGRGDKPLSAKRINEIVGVLCQILDEAADRFGFPAPTNGIRRLKLRKTDVNPFTLEQVQTILATVRADYRPYFTTRFFTGMRTGEVHGLKWKYVDFERRLILVRETFVLGEDEYTKTDGSQRDIQMSQPVYEALLLQFEATGKLSEYVFCGHTAQPLDNKNFSDRVWYPLLRYLGYERRRPYQMRHTAATLWLASGEAPEWIARQLGHTSTEMLFRVYSRYVPNLTRQDGSAIDRLLATRFSSGQLVLASSGSPDAERATYVPGQLVAPQAVPKPRGITGSRPTKSGAKPQPPPAFLMRASPAHRPYLAAAF